MPDSSSPDLIDLIYESALVPERWADTLAALRDSVDGALASMVLIPAQVGMTGTVSIAPHRRRPGYWLSRTE